jgi:hypothetical protein
MSSHSRTAEREEERRLNLRTLVIASSASAAAALLTSQLWIAGTWIAAAMTPVIVALVSEMLHRPTERIAKSLTTDRPGLAAADRAGLPAAGGAAPPPRPSADPLPERAPAEPGSGPGFPQPPAPGPGSEAPVRVYRTGGADPHGTLGGGGRPRTRRRKIAYGAVFGTAALAFVIAVAALTLPELVAGGSVGKNDGRTTLFGGSKKNSHRDREQQAPQDTTGDERQQPQEEQQQPAPDETQQPAPEEETPPAEAPSETTPLPGEPQQETAPSTPPAQP